MCSGQFFFFFLAVGGGGESGGFSVKASPVNQSQIWNFSDYPPPFSLVLISLALSHTTFQQEFGNFVISVLLLLD